MLIWERLFKFPPFSTKYACTRAQNCLVCWSTPVIGSLLVFNHADTSKQSSSGEKFLLLCDFLVIWTLRSLCWETNYSDALIGELVNEFRTFESICIKNTLSYCSCRSNWNFIIVLIKLIKISIYEKMHTISKHKIYTV